MKMAEGVQGQNFGSIDGGAGNAKDQHVDRVSETGEVFFTNQLEEAVRRQVS